jgi:magnesium transporter
MIRRMYISDNGKLQEDDKSTPLIFVYTAPTDEEKKQLIEQYKIDEHTLNSSLDPDELSRLEFEPEHIAMIFKRPKHYAAEDNFLFRVASTGVFMFKDKLIIVSADEAPLFEGRPFIKVQSMQDIVLKMINRSILHFLEHLKAINTLAGSIEQLISTSMENKYLLNLFTLEKSLVYYFNATNSNGVLIERLKNSASKVDFSPENIEILDDLAIENNQCREQANIYSQVLASLMDARASIVANNLNIRIKMLTLLTIAIMLPTFVVSYFSMNVRLPLEKDNPVSFWIITTLAILSAFAFVLLWWRRRL